MTPEERQAYIADLARVRKEERERCALIAEAMGCDAVAREIRSVEVK